MAGWLADWTGWVGHPSAPTVWPWTWTWHSQFRSAILLSLSLSCLALVHRAQSCHVNALNVLTQTHSVGVRFPQSVCSLRQTFLYNIFTNTLPEKSFVNYKTLLFTNFQLEFLYKCSEVIIKNDIISNEHMELVILLQRLRSVGKQDIFRHQTNDRSTNVSPTSISALFNYFIFTISNCPLIINTVSVV